MKAFSPHNIVALQPDIMALSVAAFQVAQATQRGRMPMARKRLQVFYSGRVQGVGFRYTVKNLSQGFELTGTVRNLADGRVELIVEGDEKELESFQGAIRESGVGPLIRGEETQWDEPKNEFRGFEIVG